MRTEAECIDRILTIQQELNGLDLDIPREKDVTKRLVMQRRHRELTTQQDALGWVLGDKE